MTFTYQSGEEIRKGDRVTFHGEPAEIEFVVREAVGDQAMDWYMTKFGCGVMVVEPNVFGRVFWSQTNTHEDLVFVTRGYGSPRQVSE
jgi:hypothetical protein